MMRGMNAFTRIISFGMRVNLILWLLSVKELSYLNGSDVTVYTEYNNLVSYNISSTTSAGWWWLRSPSSYSSYGAFYVDLYGNVYDNHVNLAFGVRAAFQLLA